MSSSAPQVGQPQSTEQFDEYYDLRWRLLRECFGLPRGSERDEFERAADHVTVRVEQGRLVGIGRLHQNNAVEAQIRYVAVATAYEGQGIGRLLVARLEALARERSCNQIVLNARDSVVGFYLRLGYRSIGTGPTLFGTLTHTRMLRQL